MRKQKLFSPIQLKRITMHKFYLITGLLLSLCLFCGSCKKFLDIQPRDELFESEAFSTKSGVYAALNGVYTQLTDSALYGRELSLGAVDQMALYYYPRYAGITPTSFYNWTMFNFSYQPIMDILTSMWADGYKTILNVNNFYANASRLNSSVVDENEKKLLMGEALALRALVHFDMLRVFGRVYSDQPDSLAIPYVTKAGYDAQPFLTGRQVLDSIAADLTTAMNLLQADPVIRDGGGRQPNTGVGADSTNIDFWALRNRRMNYFATATLLARVYLYGNKAAQAQAVAMQVLPQMMNNFQWTTSSSAAIADPVFSNEVLFGIENRQLYNLNRKMFNSALRNDSIIAPTPAKLDVVYDDPNDYRLQAWFKAGTEGDKAYKVFVKYSDANVTANRYFQPLIKKSELYLILAETSGSAATATDYLNELRAHRGLEPLTTLQSNSEALQRTGEEYAREFWGEGQLFFFYKRKNLSTISGADGASTAYMYPSRYTPPVPQQETRYR